MDANRTRVEQNKDLYRRRQAIVEHPFGTIKRGWGYTYTLLKRIRKVTGEFSLIYTAYNMRRSVSILSYKGLMDALKSWKLNLDWVGKAQFFLFSLLDALCRLTPPKPPHFCFFRPAFFRLLLAYHSPDYWTFLKKWEKARNSWFTTIMNPDASYPPAQI